MIDPITIGQWNITTVIDRDNAINIKLLKRISSS